MKGNERWADGRRIPVGSLSGPVVNPWTPREKKQFWCPRVRRQVLKDNQLDRPRVIHVNVCNSCLLMSVHMKDQALCPAQEKIGSFPLTGSQAWFSFLCCKLVTRNNGKRTLLLIPLVILLLLWHAFTCGRDKNSMPWRRRTRRKQGSHRQWYLLN